MATRKDSLISPSPSPSDSDAEFWRLGEVDPTYWNDYTATRPPYDHRILDPILSYHHSHTSTCEVAVDIGCGAGSATAALLPHFTRVIASDNDPKSLLLASQKLQSPSPSASGGLSFLLSPGEAMAEHLPASSVDLVACAEGFPLLDTHSSLSAFHSILRPNGTLAIWFYGRINFTEPDFRPTCQPILDEILDLAFSRVVKGCGPERRKAWKHTVEAMGSWMDYIPFDPERWGDVKRCKWNGHMTLPFFGQGACDFEVGTMESAVRDGEEVREERDEGFWRMELDVAGIRRFVAAVFPWPPGLGATTERMEGLFRELERGMGGGEARRAFSWPVCLVLASKRG